MEDHALQGTVCYLDNPKQNKHPTSLPHRENELAQEVQAEPKKRNRQTLSRTGTGTKKARSRRRPNLSSTARQATRASTRAPLLVFLLSLHPTDQVLIRTPPPLDRKGRPRPFAVHVLTILLGIIVRNLAHMPPVR